MYNFGLRRARRHRAAPERRHLNHNPRAGVAIPVPCSLGCAGLPSTRLWPVSDLRSPLAATRSWRGPSPAGAASGGARTGRGGSATHHLDCSARAAGRCHARAGGGRGRPVRILARSAPPRELCGGEALLVERVEATRSTTGPRRRTADRKWFIFSCLMPANFNSLFSGNSYLICRQISTVRWGV